MRNQNAARQMFIANLNDYKETGSVSASEFLTTHFENYLMLVNKVQELEALVGTEKFLRAQAESWKAQLEKVIDEMEEVNNSK